MPQYSIRVANIIDDSFKLTSLIQEGLSYTPYSKVSLHKQNMMKLVESFFKDDDKQLFLLICDEEYVGLLAACYTETHPLWFGTRIATEVFWFVHKDHRGKMSLDLIKHYEDWAKYKKCKCASLAHFSPDERLSKVYKKMKYNKIEECYLKEFV